MNVEITTYLPKATTELLRDQFGGPSLEKLRFNGDKTVTLVFTDDVEYREMIGWISAALGCGLITGGNIER